jgi:hypothetical protein
LKCTKSSGIGLIPAEVLQIGGNTFCSEIHRFSSFIFNEKELPEQLKEITFVPFYKDDKIYCGSYQGLSVLPNCIQHFAQHSFVKVKSTRRRNYWGLSMRILASSIDSR